MYEEYDEYISLTSCIIELPTQRFKGEFKNVICYSLNLIQFMYNQSHFYLPSDLSIAR